MCGQKERCDMENHVIRVISTTGVKTLAGSPNNKGNCDGTGKDARFEHPFDISCGHGCLWVTDSNRVARIIKKE